VPSAGALYPLEIFFHSIESESVKAGLYHYNPIENRLRLVRGGDATADISKAMVQPDIAPRASVIIFITAVFERTVFKYADRGYRFIFLEAGHVAQNMDLVSQALGLGCVNIGGYFDREVDDFLGIDGLTHSTIYMMAIGKKNETIIPG
jgi:SagB-type dehydrogenase family enzyme